MLTTTKKKIYKKYISFRKKLYKIHDAKADCQPKNSTDFLNCTSVYQNSNFNFLLKLAVKYFKNHKNKTRHKQQSTNVILVEIE